MLATNLTDSNGTLNFVGTVLGRLCPGNSHEAVLESSKSHLNPFQLLFVACLVVSIFSMIPILIRIETWLFDLDGDGKVDGSDAMYCLRVYCRCGGAKKTSESGVKVLPVQAVEAVTPLIDDINDRVKSKWMILKKAYLKGKTLPETTLPETKKVSKVDTKKPTMFRAMTSMTPNADSIVEETFASGNEDLDSQMTDAKESGDSVYEGWLSIVYTLLFLYSAVVYMTTTGLANITGDFVDTIFCKAGQIVLLPLFKPATLSLWPAFMPLVQLAYWMIIAERANQANREVSIGGNLNKPWMVYTGIVSPGEQPFEFNAITMAQTRLISCVVIVYMLAGMVFLPLVIVFGIILLPAIFSIAFIVMYLPMQLASGRFIRCLCPLLMVTRCCQPKDGASAPANGGVSEQIDLMSLKAMGTLFFALLSSSVYFTPFYFGGEEGGWRNLVGQLAYELDITNVVHMFEDLHLVLAWPDMHVSFVAPAVLSLGVIVLQYSTSLVRHIYNTYFKTRKYTSKDFMRPMLPIKTIFVFGMMVQSGFLVMWDFIFVCWALLSCQLPSFVCCRICGCFYATQDEQHDHDEKEKNKSCCLPFCKRLCGYYGQQEKFRLSAQIHFNSQKVMSDGMAASSLSHYIEHKTGGTYTLVEPSDLNRHLWFASSSKESLKGLKYLDFSGDDFGIDGLPDWVGHPNLINVEELSLVYSSGITSLPESMFRLINLQELYLDGCRGLTEIPGAIGKLIKLRELYLKQCSGLVELPDSIGRLVNLEVFNLLECKKLKKLPDTMGQLVKLEVLNLSACVLLTTLPGSMSQMVNLEWLNLAKCSGLPDIPECIRPLLPKLNIKRVCPFR